MLCLIWKHAIKKIQNRRVYNTRCFIGLNPYDMSNELWLVTVSFQNSLLIEISYFKYWIAGR